LSRRETVRQALEAVASIPRDGDGPVFAEPWQAQAFAMAVTLNERGYFTWHEWTEVLGRTITAAGPHTRAEDYYLHWLSALETIVTRKALLDASQLHERRDAWDRAARATPHGEPIELGRE